MCFGGGTWRALGVLHRSIEDLRVGEREGKEESEEGSLEEPKDKL